jgi:hypothetical protein
VISHVRALLIVAGIAAIVWVALLTAGDGSGERFDRPMRGAAASQSDPLLILREMAAHAGRSAPVDVLAPGSPLRGSRSPYPAGDIDRRRTEVLATMPGEMRVRESVVVRDWNVDIDGEAIAVHRGRTLVVIEWTLRKVDGAWLAYDAAVVARRRLTSSG